MAHLFYLVETNPNETTGGGGDIAGPEKDPDSTGPYFVWPNQEFESGASPFAVVSAGALRAMQKTLDAHEAGDEVLLSGGEREAVAPAIVEAPTGAGEGPESEVYDLSDPNDFARAFRGE